MIRSSVGPALSGPPRGRPRRGPRRLLAAGVCALGMLLSACGGDSGASPRTAGTPRPGGEVTLSLPGDVVSLDPLNSSYENVTDGSRLTAIYDVLLWTDPVTGTVRPQMAESMTSDRDGRNWVLKLRPNIKFSDGTSLDAEAVKANWQRMAIGSPFALAVGQIDSMQRSPNDPLQLDIKLKQPNANFDRTVSKNLNFIGSPAAISAGGPKGLRDKPVGAGPFVLESYSPGGPLVLKRNERYWQADKGLPYLERLTFTPDMDVQHSVRRVGKHDLDMTVTVDPMALAEAKEKMKVGTRDLRLNGGAMVLFNTKAAPFNNLKARQAVAYALDAGEINDRIYGGKGTPARGIFNSVSPLANNQLAAPSNDPAKAAQLFDEVTQNGTKKLEFTYVVPNAPVTEQMARLMAAKLNAYRGVTMNVRAVSILDYIMSIRAGGNWQAAIGQNWIDDPEPLLYDLLHKTSPRNTSGIDQADINSALDIARQTSDPGARRDAYTQVQMALNREMPFWVYQEAVGAAVFHPKITGVQLMNDGLILWDRLGWRT